MRRRQLLMLEDCPGRIARMRRVIEHLDSPTSILIWANAHDMVRALPVQLANSGLVSLDHDLLESDQGDPGDGLQVARYLASIAPTCHVIVHTSNSERGRAMMGELELAGWACSRILPLGDDWIEQDWASEVRTRLA